MRQAADHARWADATGAYVLAALEPDERAGFEAHLQACETCAQEVEALRPAVAALSRSVTPLHPPADVRQRVMAEVEREARLVTAETRDVRRPQRGRRSRRSVWRARVLAPAVAGVLLIGVGGTLAVETLRSDGQTVAVEVDGQQAPGTHAAMILEDGHATLRAEGLPTPPDGRVYQVWLGRSDRPPEPTSALFVPRADGTARATVPGPLDAVQQVLVTQEPRGGSRSPSRAPVLVASLP